MTRAGKRLALAASVTGVAALAFMVGRALAGGIPAMGALTYSGTLEDASGAPLSGSHNIEVKVWDAVSGGTSPLCTTGSQAVDLAGGHFSVTLPDDCTGAVKANADLWADVLVDGSSLGRTKLGAVPYAVEAGHAAEASAATTASTGSTLETTLTSLDARATTLEKAPHTYLYSGALATPTEWEADLIFNKNYKRFCDALGKQFVSAVELVNHYNPGRTNGFFYQDWYYVGPRTCDGDTFYAGNTDPTNAYNVWKYSGTCGCCPNGGWTVEARALITCQ